LNGILYDQVRHAASVIQDGGLVAFPTETYYGLAVDPFNEHALQRLFRVKNRPVMKPVLVLIASLDQLEMLASSVPETAAGLMEHFWPGSVTMVLPARPDLSRILTGSTSTVGVRLSPHPVATALVKACGIPLTATSANTSGDPAAVSADEVRSIFGGEVDFILDGGKTPGRHGSTLIGFGEKKVECIREGVVRFQDILDAI
jgi:L-threonylcarbamoyladenylate synthase